MVDSFHFNISICKSKLPIIDEEVNISLDNDEQVGCVALIMKK